MNNKCSKCSQLKQDIIIPGEQYKRKIYCTKYIPCSRFGICDRCCDTCSGLKGYIAKININITYHGPEVVTIYEFRRMVNDHVDDQT